MVPKAARAFQFSPHPQAANFENWKALKKAAAIGYTSFTCEILYQIVEYDRQAGIDPG
jgi:hypothetical protein